MKSHSGKSSIFILLLAVTLFACSSPSTPGDANNIAAPNNGGANSGENNTNSQSNANASSEDSNEVAVNEADEEAVDVEPLYLMTDDATNVVDNTDTEDRHLSYNTALPLEEVLEFYKVEMGAQGYSLTVDILVADNAVLRFEQGNVAMVVSTNQDGAGGFSISVVHDK